jgi:1-acyl-sn-glycerol-3-phosphate acyltransferase
MATEATSRPARSPSSASSAPDRSRLARLWYLFVQRMTFLLFAINGGLRASGRSHLPASGAALMVSNHLSHLDVFVIGIPTSRPLNYVARSTLFFPPLGALIRSVGGYPIQREGMGAQGLKETLKRLRAGGIVVLFPEGTRSRDGELGELKAGLAVLATRAKVPILPVAVAGTFERLPRGRIVPHRHPVWIHYGPPIPPDEIAGLSAEAITALIRERILACQNEARRGIAHLLGPDAAEAAACVQPPFPCRQSTK